jgi:hypothetical protein
VLKKKRVITIIVFVVVLGMVASMVIYGFFIPGGEEEKSKNETRELDRQLEETIRVYGPVAKEILGLKDTLVTLEPGTEQYTQVESRIQVLTNEISGQFTGLATNRDENGNVTYVDQAAYEAALRGLAGAYDDRYGG